MFLQANGMSRLTRQPKVESAKGTLPVTRLIGTYPAATTADELVDRPSVVRLNTLIQANAIWSCEQQVGAGRVQVWRIGPNPH